MKKYIYTVCPVCQHPNVHVYDGLIADHVPNIHSGFLCAGSGKRASENREHRILRGSQLYTEVLAKMKPPNEAVPPKAVPPKAVVVVRGGVAEATYCPDGMEVEIVDMDNIMGGKRTPAAWAALTENEREAVLDEYGPAAEQTFFNMPE